ncbi:CPBP family intramembrane glutamic endopeptidase [Winogradskyella luteola]|uniref:CPBP family intramembrane metalloprotease n=1 Tax=Winogradskyella luteola TaxID=2828330 RepID=A0A9X1F7D8_9FLAO|nr:CPBP family intramembrane glutamic endopeptidase [Winogradskyella luteola]MBV7268787.1 CPBP family intramembrane metalloprotease [Winogradskyella luteola]
MNNSCSRCKAIVKNQAKFCTNCGNSLKKTNLETRTSSLNIIIVFYAVFLLFAVVSYFLYSEYPTNINIEIAIESVFALLVVGFSLVDFKGILKLYKLPIIDWKILIFTVAFPVFSAFTVYFTVEHANSFLFGSVDESYYGGYVYLEHPLFWAILFTAIMPPIFEELAFRGFLFNQLQKVASENVTIIATAFIFALVHFSFISLIWILPFGLILGYIRSKYNTLWYGIVIHFIHNFIVIMIDYYIYNTYFLEL